MADQSSNPSGTKGQAPVKGSSTEISSKRKPATLSSFDPNAPQPSTPSDAFEGMDIDELESDAEEINLDEVVERNKVLDQGAANAGAGSETAKPPSYLLPFYKTLYPTFKSFWYCQLDFTDDLFTKINHDIRALMLKHGDEHKKTPGELGFKPFETVMYRANKCFTGSDKMTDEELTSAWVTADKINADMARDLELGGFPKEFGPPGDWIEKSTKLQRPGGGATKDKESVSSVSLGVNSGPKEAPVMSHSNKEWNPDAGDSIQDLSRAHGAEILPATEGGVCGYSRRGGGWEVLVKEGNGTDIRYRLVSALQAPTFNRDRPTGQNLTIG